MGATGFSSNLVAVEPCKSRNALFIRVFEGVAVLAKMVYPVGRL
jgi:hypothetical protein